LNHSDQLIDPSVRAVLVAVKSCLVEHGVNGYLVGGWVRDILLGKRTADIDIAIDRDVISIGPTIAEAVKGKFILLDATNRIGRIVGEEEGQVLGVQWHIDVSTMEGDILLDLARRDFTVDAMGISLKELLEEPSKAKVLDPFGGSGDLELKILRAVSGSVFESDPARLLRAVRLASQLDFTVAPETEDLIRNQSQLVIRVAGERVREELLRILGCNRSGHFLRYLDKLGLLTLLVPELAKAKGVEQPVEHFWDVFDHSIETVTAVDFLLRNGQWPYQSPDILSVAPWSERLERHFGSEVGEGSKHSSLLKVAALFHDVAKPETKIMAEDRVRFFGHPDQGAEVACQILERLRFSKRETKIVQVMVGSHMRPTQMSREGMPTHRAVYRFFRDTGDAAIDVLFLSLADHLAARGPGLDFGQWRMHAQQTSYIIRECLEGEHKIISPPKLIDGHDLINLFGMKPGEKIRLVLESVREAQAAGELNTREEALSYVRNSLLYREQK
jgi:poly(A) polymerase